MDIVAYIFIALIICALIVVKKSLVIIPQSETKIIERLGKYYATLKPGINIIIPFIDRAKEIVTMRRALHLQQLYRPSRAGLRLRQAERDYKRQCADAD